MEFQETDRMFDTIICFETIEHVQVPEVVFDNFRKILKPNGILIISSPNRKLTSPNSKDNHNLANKFHFFEYSTHEFITNTRKYFAVNSIYGQRGISKLLLIPVIKKVLTSNSIKLFSLYDGSSLLEIYSVFNEYRYITLLCKNCIK